MAGREAFEGGLRAGEEAPEEGEIASVVLHW